MKIVVIGGTGRIGSQVVNKLRAVGCEAIPAAPETGVDTLTGKGLPEALAGADVVVDVSNSPSFEDVAVLNFFRTSTGNLLAAGAAAGVKHHVVLSVVGTDRMSESGYMRAKVVQETLIRGSSIPFSIVHATQFFEFAKGIADSATDHSTVRVPNAFIQPIAAEEVAAAVAKVAVGSPVNGIVEVGGPEAMRMEEFVRRDLQARGDAREVVADRDARYFGAKLEERTLLPGEGAILGVIHFDEWLAGGVIRR